MNREIGLGMSLSIEQNDQEDLESSAITSNFDETLQTYEELFSDLIVMNGKLNTYISDIDPSLLEISNYNIAKIQQGLSMLRVGNMDSLVLLDEGINGECSSCESKIKKIMFNHKHLSSNLVKDITSKITEIRNKNNECLQYFTKSEETNEKKHVKDEIFDSDVSLPSASTEPVLNPITSPSLPPFDATFIDTTLEQTVREESKKTIENASSAPIDNVAISHSASLGNSGQISFSEVEVKMNIDSEDDKQDVMPETKSHRAIGTKTEKLKELTSEVESQKEEKMKKDDESQRELIPTRNTQNEKMSTIENQKEEISVAEYRNNDLDTTKEPNTNELQRHMQSNVDVQIQESETNNEAIEFVTEKDPNPGRITNPLLQLPPFPRSSINLSIDEIPNAAEIWKLMELYYCPPDTFPLEYYTRLLGFELIDKSLMTKDISIMSTKDFVSSFRRKDSAITPCDNFLEKKEYFHRVLSRNVRFDYVDPIWNLLSRMNFCDYTSKKFTPYQKSSIVPNGFLSETSSVHKICLDTAFNLGVLTNKQQIDFRFTSNALEEDNLFTNFNVKGYQAELLSKAFEYGKRDSHFVLLCYDKNSDAVLGYIYYTISGMHSDLKTYQYSDSNLNRDIFLFQIQQLVSNHNSLISKTLIDLLLVIFAIAHVRAESVSYGIFETVYRKDFYEKYFRMHCVDTRQLGEKTSFLMVSDLSRYSARYALLSFKEGEDEKEKSQHSEKQRIILKMPCLDDCKEYFYNAIPTSKEVVEDDPKKRLSMSSVSSGKSNSIKTSDGGKLIEFLSNPSSKIQSKKAIRIRVNFSGFPYFPSRIDDEKSCITKCYKVSGNLQVMEEQPRDGVILNEEDNELFDFVSKLPDCKILRRFPLIENGHKFQEGNVENENKIIAEIKAKSCELAKIQESYEPKLRHFLGKLFEQKKEYHSKASYANRRNVENNLLEIDRLLSYRRDADLAWKTQMEQDMDAVCDVCGDGEVTPENQIIFCEACNVAIHQHCYKILSVPEGDYFCKVCRLIKKENKLNELLRPDDKDGEKLLALPVQCQLCPIQKGAFVRTQTCSKIPTKKKRKEQNILQSSDWVHVVCAKWQGLNYVDEVNFDLIEDVTELKESFRALKLKCALCKGSRGAFIKCREKNCKNHMHVTCARASGMCILTHGENSSGLISGEEAWTLVCPEHSKIASPAKGSMTLEELEELAKQFPQDVLLKVDLKPFDQLNASERQKFWSIPEAESELILILMNRLEGARCEVCYERDDNEAEPSDKSGNKTELFMNTLSRCTDCGIVVHADCYDPSGNNTCVNQNASNKRLRQRNKNYTRQTVTELYVKDFICDICSHIKEVESRGEFLEENPTCHMCHDKGGVLKRAFANPVSKKKWNSKSPKNDKDFGKSLFGKQIWCHAICGMWHPQCIMDGNEFNCSSVVMACGRKHIQSKWECCLCGKKDKVKLPCSHENCHFVGIENGPPMKFHMTCARQAGFETHDAPNDKTGTVDFKVKCYQHKSNNHAIRARLEDFIELEKLRAGLEFENVDKPMSISHAAKLFHWAVTILTNFGWAWRWADWWVEIGDTWEPLLEEGQKEEDMTKEQLRIVDSDKQSRCNDARRCRLAAFGAALRNRSYDSEPDGGRRALRNALRAIFHTPSLVGPLKQFEIDFFVDWLGVAYRSKSHLLGFGSEKIPVETKINSSCRHIDDNSPKYELGTRPLPGKQTLEDDQIFEVGIEEPDDFLQYRRPQIQIHDIPNLGSRIKEETDNETTSLNSSELKTSLSFWTPKAIASKRRRRDQENVITADVYSTPKVNNTHEVSGKRKSKKSAKAQSYNDDDEYELVLSSSKRKRAQTTLKEPSDTLALPYAISTPANTGLIVSTRRMGSNSRSSEDSTAKAAGTEIKPTPTMKTRRGGARRSTSYREFDEDDVFDAVDMHVEINID